MSAAERQELTQIAEAVGGPFARSMVAARHFGLSWAGSVLIVFVVWLSVAWPARLMGGLDVGLQSPYAPWIFVLGVPLCAAYALVSTVLSMRQRRDLRPALRADLDNGNATEESYRFTAARRFQEPEHGGLIYFLHTDDDRVFVLYDTESQDLGARGANPLTSRFAPKSELRVVRAPSSAIVLGKSFAGEVLDAGEPLELGLPPKEWPESEAYYDVPWTELEARLARPGITQA